mmetsp:Transcript_95530/g.270044  ORF Transcript_95530/g.270044 Transcript_95530/m.270044 type:complete len:262 (-) Transcript_95530:1501-2286(-)
MQREPGVHARALAADHEPLPRGRRRRRAHPPLQLPAVDPRLGCDHHRCLGHPRVCHQHRAIRPGPGAHPDPARLLRGDDTGLRRAAAADVGEVRLRHRRVRLLLLHGAGLCGLPGRALREAGRRRDDDAGLRGRLQGPAGAAGLRALGGAAKGEARGRDRPAARRRLRVLGLPGEAGGGQGGTQGPGGPQGPAQGLGDAGGRRRAGLLLRPQARGERPPGPDHGKQGGVEPGRLGGPGREPEEHGRCHRGLRHGGRARRRR